MRVHTCHTIYTLADAGDGAFLISGHPIYCPQALLVTLVEPPQIGRGLRFRAVDLDLRRRRKRVVTTPVVRIEVSRDAQHRSCELNNKMIVKVDR
jgi:hypothetical protein